MIFFIILTLGLAVFHAYRAGCYSVNKEDRTKMWIEIARTLLWYIGYLIIS